MKYSLILAETDLIMLRKIQMFLSHDYENAKYILVHTAVLKI